jgi:hypothetical protein
MNREQIKNWLYECAREHVEKGPGFAQQGVVLRAARASLKLATTAEEQKVLGCWHELFREGRLAWGYNLDNPDSPFFHIPVSVAAAG